MSWLIRPDGSENHAVTHGASDSAEGRTHFELYRWSPDGRRLAMLGHRSDAMGVSHLGLYIVDAVSGETNTVIANSRESSTFFAGYDHAFSWSPSGSRLALVASQYQRHGEPGDNQELTDQQDFLATYDLAARKLSRLATARPVEDGQKLSLGWWTWPSWSPSGKQLLATPGRCDQHRRRNVRTGPVPGHRGRRSRARERGASDEACHACLRLRGDGRVRRRSGPHRPAMSAGVRNRGGASGQLSRLRLACRTQRASDHHLRAGESGCDQARHRAAGPTGSPSPGGGARHRVDGGR